MFRFLKIKRPDTCPVPEETRIWLEGAFQQLLDFWGIEKTINRKVLIPHYNDFPIQYNGTEQSAIKTLEVIAIQMEIPIDSIHLEFYTGGLNQIGAGSLPGQGLYLENGRNNPAGMYWGKNESDKFIVSLERSQLSLPENMVATLAHELAHIKLLGEKRMSHNDERLTDLVTVLFGLGVTGIGLRLMLVFRYYTLNLKGNNICKLLFLSCLAKKCGYHRIAQKQLRFINYPTGKSFQLLISPDYW